jgi:hypothetical protein
VSRKGMVPTGLREQDKELYRQGIHALVSRRKAVVDGDCGKTGFGDKLSHMIFE